MNDYERKLQNIDPDQIKRTVGSLARRYRERAGLTQKQLGELVYHSTNQISRIEKGENALTIETLFKLCALYDVTPNSILGFFEQKTMNEYDRKMLAEFSTLSDADKNRFLQMIVAFKES